MRKNKKLLLASVAAMGALALGVGATSTFAWFTATTAATLNAANDTTGQNLTVDHVQADVGTVAVNGLVVAVQEPTWANKGSGKKLELAHVPAASNSANVPNYAAGRVTDGGVAPGLSTAWLGNEGSPVVHELGFTNAGAPVTSGTGNAVYGTITVKLTTQEAADTYGYVHSASDIADDVNDKYITLTFSNKSGVGDEAIRFFANNETLLDESANNANTLAITVQLDGDSLKGDGQIVTAYFFVLGDNVTDSDVSAGVANVGTILASTSASRDNA